MGATPEQATAFRLIAQLKSLCEDEDALFDDRFYSLRNIERLHEFDIDLHEEVARRKKLAG